MDDRSFIIAVLRLYKLIKVYNGFGYVV